jgi:hypothetical protein
MRTCADVRRVLTYADVSIRQHTSACYTQLSNSICVCIYRERFECISGIIYIYMVCMCVCVCVYLCVCVCVCIYIHTHREGGMECVPVY